MAYTYLGGGGVGGFSGNVTVPYTVTGSVTAGTTYTLASGSNGTAWATVATGTNTPSITVTGDAEFNGKLKVQGKDLCESIEKIESYLGILRPNIALEKEFDELKRLGDQYREAEKKFTEQKRIFDILKKQD